MKIDEFKDKLFIKLVEKKEFLEEDRKEFDTLAPEFDREWDIFLEIINEAVDEAVSEAHDAYPIE